MFNEKLAKFEMKFYCSSLRSLLWPSFGIILGRKQCDQSARYLLGH